MRITLGSIIMTFLLWVSFSAAQTDQTSSWREIELQQSADGVDLCFLPVETIVGAQVHVVVESFPYSAGNAVYSGLKATTLTVSNTGAPIVIILKATHRDADWVWRFNIESGANLVGVHIISEELPRIEGIPSNVPVTGRTRVDGRDNDCVYPPAMNADLTEYGAENLRSRETAFQNWHGAFGLPALDTNLFDYAGISVVSYQFPTGGWEDATVDVSEVSSQEFSATKARGQLLLDEAVPPTLPFVDEMAGSLRVPEGLQRGEVWPWVISQGYAMAVPDELPEYLCQIDRLMEMALGVVLPKAGCRWGGIFRTQNANGMVLLGSIEMSSETCRTARQPRPLFARLDMAVVVGGSGCSINIFDINTKTFF